MQNLEKKKTTKKRSIITILRIEKNKGNSRSIDPNEVAHKKLDLCCLQVHLFMIFGALGLITELKIKLGLK